MTLEKIKCYVDELIMSLHDVNQQIKELEDILNNFNFNDSFSQQKTKNVFQQLPFCLDENES